MSKSIKIAALLGLAGFVAACAQQEEEFVVIEPVQPVAPISVEPVSTGKYK